MEQIVYFVVVIGIAFLFGRRNEKAHLKSLDERETKTLKMAVIPGIEGLEKLPIKQTELAMGNVALGDNYFTNFLSTMKGLIGGRISSYEVLIDRARREAILRMKESVPNADMIVNLKIDTSVLDDKNKGKSSITSVQVLASGTAIYLDKVEHII